MFNSCDVIYSRVKGASFCQVDRISPVSRGSPCSTSGNQKCIGATPIFSARAIVIIGADKLFDSSIVFHSPVIQALLRVANNSSPDAVAWVRKYFVVASVARG